MACPRWACYPRWHSTRGSRGASSLSVNESKTTHQLSVVYPLRTVIRGETDGKSLDTSSGSEVGRVTVVEYIAVNRCICRVNRVSGQWLTLPEDKTRPSSRAGSQPAMGEQGYDLVEQLRRGGCCSSQNRAYSHAFRGNKCI